MAPMAPTKVRGESMTKDLSKQKYEEYRAIERKARQKETTAVFEALSRVIIFFVRLIAGVLAIIGSVFFWAYAHQAGSWSIMEPLAISILAAAVFCLPLWSDS